jgi:starch phosphorylase
MVKEYVNNMYLPAVKNTASFIDSNFKIAKELAQWIDRVHNQWGKLRVKVDENILSNNSIVLKYKQPLKLSCEVYLGELKPEEVKVQIYLVEDDDDLGNEKRATEKRFELVEMEKKSDLDKKRYLYETTFIPSESGNFHFSIRTLPYHKDQSSLVETGLIHWLNNTH